MPRPKPDKEITALKNILEELQSREPIFHHPEKFGTTREDIEAQMTPEFWEVGASGKIYTRITRRSTIWRKVNSDWKIVYHQGTIAL